MDRLHAAYIFVHHIASVFAENVSQLLEMWTFTKRRLGKPRKITYPTVHRSAGLTHHNSEAPVIWEVSYPEQTQTFPPYVLQLSDSVVSNTANCYFRTII